MLLIHSITCSMSLVHHLLPCLMELAWKTHPLLFHMGIQLLNDRKSIACWSMPHLHLLRLARRIGSGQLLPLTMENVIRTTLVMKGPYHLPARGHKSVQIIMIRRVTPFRYFHITNPEAIIEEFGRPPCVDTSI